MVQVVAVRHVAAIGYVDPQFREGGREHARVRRRPTIVIRRKRIEQHLLDLFRKRWLTEVIQDGGIGGVDLSLDGGVVRPIAKQLSESGDRGDDVLGVPVCQ